MAMEITNNYSNYAANYTDISKKSGSKAAAEAKANTSTNSKDKVQEYQWHKTKFICIKY